MFAKSTVIFVLCFIALGLAAPDHKNHKHEHEGSHEADSEEHHKDGSGHHKKPHDAYQVKLDSPFQKIKNDTSHWYSEFFIVASGDRFHAVDVPKETHIAARAIVLLSQKLHAMTEVYELLANTSSDFALNGVKTNEKDVMTKFVNGIVDHIKKCPSLAAEFETIKSGLSDSFISPGKFFTPEIVALPELNIKATESWIKDPFMKAAILNRMFFAKSWRDDHHSCKIAKSLIQESNNPEVHDKLEKTYADAVAKTIEVVCPAHEKDKADALLFRNLMELFVEDGPLSVKLFGNKKILLLNHYVLW